MSAADKLRLLEIAAAWEKRAQEADGDSKLIGVNPSRTLLHYFDFRPSCWVRRGFPVVFFLQSVKKRAGPVRRSVCRTRSGVGWKVSTKSGMRCAWRRNVGGGLLEIDPPGRLGSQASPTASFCEVKHWSRNGERHEHQQEQSKCMIVVDDRHFRRGSRNWRGPLRLFGARDRLRQNIARARDDTAGRGLGVVCTW
jgi:hypothetical protein